MWAPSKSKTFDVLESRQINSIAPCERHLALVINIEKSTFFVVAHHALQTIWLASENVIFGENEEQEKMRNDFKNDDYSNLASNIGRISMGK